MIRKTIASLISLLVFGMSACAQEPPENRPGLKNEELDRKLVRLLRFDVPLIGVEELKAEKDEVYLFDVREQEEYQVSHIPGAAYLGYRDFDPSRLEGIPKDAPIVLYCSVGYRSERIGSRLRKQGYTRVRNLYGSIFEWTNRGYALEDPEGKPVQAVHTYNKSWSRWVDENAARRVW